MDMRDNYPGRQSGYIYAAQRELMKKHHEAKSRVHSVSGVGGGVSLWPAMDDMRLTRREANWLVISCGLLILGTMSVFLACHGGWTMWIDYASVEGFPVLLSIKFCKSNHLD